MIEICLKDYPYAPFQPKVLVVDEAQDFTRLQLKLARSWGADMEELILVGDDDQAIFSFVGSTHDAFLDPPIPDCNKKLYGNKIFYSRKYVLSNFYFLLLFYL